MYVAGQAWSNPINGTYRTGHQTEKVDKTAARWIRPGKREFQANRKSFFGLNSPLHCSCFISSKGLGHRSVAPHLPSLSGRRACCLCSEPSIEDSVWRNCRFPRKNRPNKSRRDTHSTQVCCATRKRYQTCPHLLQLASIERVACSLAEGAPCGSGQ